MVLGALIAAAAFVWIFQPMPVLAALGEYLWPTTVEWEEIGCSDRSEPPSVELSAIVERQTNLHHLQLQRTVTCEISRTPGVERRYPGIPLGEKFRTRWRTLSGGCCAARRGRHVLVVAGEAAGDATLIVEAALVQSRWDHLREAADVFGRKWNRMWGYVLGREAEGPMRSFEESGQPSATHVWPSLVKIRLPGLPSMTVRIALDKLGKAMPITKRLTIENVNLDDDAELDAFDDQVINAGLERVRTEGDELRRRGILDAQGNLLPK